MASRKVLITGGMGFIGKFLVRKILSERDYEISIVDNLSSSSMDRQIIENSRVSFFEEDFSEWKLPEEENYHQIYHLSSPVGPVGILKYKGIIGKIIVNQLYKVSSMAIDMGAKLMEISTSEVYGKHPDNEDEGQRESIDKIVPSTITVRLEYGVAKLLCEIILKNLSRENDLNYICVRPFNIVGPTQNDDLGFVVPRFLRQALTNQPITIYGDGTQKRTFTHVEDFADAAFSLMESDVSGDVFNIGNPDNVISIIELAKKIKESTKSLSELVFVDPKTLFGNDFAEAWNKIPNVEKLISTIEWEPRWYLDGIVKQISSFSKDYLIKK